MYSLPKDVCVFWTVAGSFTKSTRRRTIWGLRNPICFWVAPSRRIERSDYYEDAPFRHPAANEHLHHDLITDLRREARPRWEKDMKSLQIGRKRKHQHIYEEIRQGILSGKYPKGKRLPSEIHLAKQFRTSRPTVARAFRDLVQQNLIERRAGSGTYVSIPRTQSRYFLGLLIPELGQTEIFEPICQGVAQAREGTRHELVWVTVLPTFPRRDRLKSSASSTLRAK